MIKSSVGVADSKIDKLQKKVEKIEVGLNSKIDKLQKKVEKIEVGLSGTNIRFEMLEARLDEMEKKDTERYDKLMENLLWLVGQFKRFDEEHTVLAHRQSVHTDKIEKLEKSVFGTSVS